MPTEVLYFIAAILTTMGGWFMRNQMGRIDMLETQMQTKVNESQVRLVLDDKIEPLKEDLQEIKETLRVLLGIALETNRKSNG